MFGKACRIIRPDIRYRARKTKSGPTLIFLQESELWHSLGEAWYVPREHWKGYVPPYNPVFMDGWKPRCRARNF